MSDENAELSLSPDALNESLTRGTWTRDEVRYVAAFERDKAQAMADDLAARETKLLASERRQLVKARDRAFAFAQLLDDLEPVHVLSAYDRWGPFDPKEYRHEQPPA